MSHDLLAVSLIDTLTKRGERVACAESLTGGLLTSALVDVPGASLVVSGAVVAYTEEIKTSLLGVERVLLAERGAVDEQVALQMAHGVRERFSIAGKAAEYGLATTGVAGPGAQGGHPAGTVWLAVVGETQEQTELLHLPGERAEVRAGAVRAMLNLLARFINR